MPEGSDGIMDYSIKTIKIAELVQEKDSVRDLQLYMKQVVRHEIIHAFLYESDYGVTVIRQIVGH